MGNAQVSAHEFTHLALERLSQISPVFVAVPNYYPYSPDSSQSSKITCPSIYMRVTVPNSLRHSIPISCLQL